MTDHDLTLTKGQVARLISNVLDDDLGYKVQIGPDAVLVAVVGPAAPGVDPESTLPATARPGPSEEPTGDCSPGNHENCAPNPTRRSRRRPCPGCGMLLHPKGNGTHFNACAGMVKVNGTWEPRLVDEG